MTKLVNILLKSILGGAAFWLLAAFILSFMNPGISFANALADLEATTIGICTFAGILVLYSIAAANSKPYMPIKIH